MTKKNSGEDETAQKISQLEQQVSFLQVKLNITEQQRNQATTQAAELATTVTILEHRANQANADNVAADVQ